VTASIDHPPPDLEYFSVPELLRLSRAILRELRSRGIVRSGNAPAGDYAELLVQRATAGDLAPKSQKSWDVLTADRTRVQVKARVITPENPSRQLSPIRSWDFDQLAIVLFDDHFDITHAVFLDRAIAEPRARWNEHVKGWRLFATATLLAAGTDRTAELAAQSQGRIVGTFED
jgi:hypothetical protein